MVIRDFMASDQDGASAVIQLGMKERWGPEYDPSFNPDTLDIAGRYTVAGAQFLVAEQDHRIVGTGALVPVDATTSRILRMAVDPNHRRMGIARQIVDSLIMRARERGDTRILVSTDIPWTSANKLYLACGFELTHSDEIDNHYVMELVD